ncbi:MAG: UDP-N-acetylmuramoyl-L-alanine--D-glutamate ligase [Candidatus Saccharibacteria bacterium]|nr:UDP-N-acetylmuramoyl-L-alanine--D-glutamate ligase [Candidatus Saccharibacteria bacterium]
MKIALLGYGKEGQSTEKYFGAKGAEFDIFKDFTFDEIRNKDYSSYDIILRSPSVPPLENEPKLSSLTRYFFDHCPCKIIGVTATKGKGTTCSFIKSLLDAHGEKAYLVGNIGNPAIEILDELTEDSIVVYEMSSFQLWDLEKSPSISVIGTIEPDHLNVHNGMDDYLNAKANIGRYQSEDDFMIYFKDNADSVRLAGVSKAKKIPYPFDIPAEIAESIKLPGKHNKTNAIAAIAAVASFYNISPDEYLQKFPEVIKQGLSNFRGLPHRLEFIREKDSVKYYDDNFSTNPASTRVAIEAFPDENVILIVGGRDKTNNADLPEIFETIIAKNVKKIVLIGESGHELAKRYNDPRFEIAESLEEAVGLADSAAKSYDSAVVLMSPSAASFDMFESVYDRGGKYQKLVSEI